MDTKICSKCGRELPLSEFHKNKDHKDGHSNVCKECHKKYYKQYYQDNREVRLERQKQYYQEHKEEKSEYLKQYYETPIGMANRLVNNYKRLDKQYNRGECTLTAQWIIDNIFTKPCHWCKKTNWHKLGCDRIDNDKPHTPDNVIPCCEECNKKRGTKTYEEFLKLIKAPVTYV